MIMNKRTPVPGYRLLPSPSTKLKLKDNHYETPCIFTLTKACQNLLLQIHLVDLFSPFIGSGSKKSMENLFDIPFDIK